MSSINNEKMEKISKEIFEVSKKYPGKVEIKNMKEPISRSEITHAFGHQFEAEFKIDDEAVIKKIIAIVGRSYRNYVWILANPFDLKYELYSHSGS
jgi:hypothetical protein